MAATMATAMAMLNAKCMTTNTPKTMIKPTTTTTKLAANSLLSLQNLPKGLTGTAVAGAVFSTLSACDPAVAVQQIAEIAESSSSGDNRGLALLLPIIPAIAWVLFNILQPALNQLSRMRESKGVVAGLGLSGLAALGLASAPEASAGEVAAIAEAAANDNRGQLLLIVITPAVLWVLYNILQPALNQLNRMRSE